jgi:hypothetical protein
LSEETLAGADEPAKPGSVRLAGKLKLGGVVDHEHVRMLRRAPRGLPEMRSQNRLGRRLIVAEEPIRSFEFGVVERLGKLSLGRSANLSASRPSRRFNRRSPRSAPQQLGGDCGYVNDRLAGHACRGITAGITGQDV